MICVRYEAAVANARGRHTGIFGLANGLAHRGELSSRDRLWLLENNHWLDDAYPDPGIADPTLFDRSINPTATCWFKLITEAEPFLARVPAYLALLDRYGVAWRVRKAEEIGRVLYEDPIQVIAAE